MTFNHWAVTRCFIDALPNLKDQLLKEVIFIDNGSQDQTVFSLRQLNYTVLQTSHNSISLALNTAFDYDRECDVLVISNDHILTNGTIDALVKVKDDHEIGLLSPFVFISHDNLLNMDSVYNKELYSQYYVKRRQTLAHETYEGFVELSKWLYPEGAEVAAQNFIRRHENDYPYFTGFWPGCCLHDRGALNKIGRYDENFVGAGYEDMDYHRRANSFNVKVAVTSRAFVHHFGSVTTRKFLDEKDNLMIQYEIQNGKYYEKKYGIC